MKVGTLLKIFQTQTALAKFVGTSRPNVANWGVDDDLPELYDLRMRRDHPYMVKAVEIIDNLNKL